MDMSHTENMPVKFLIPCHTIFCSKMRLLPYPRFNPQGRPLRYKKNRRGQQQADLPRRGRAHILSTNRKEILDFALLVYSQDTLELQRSTFLFAEDKTQVVIPPVAVLDASFEKRKKVGLGDEPMPDDLIVLVSDKELHPVRCLDLFGREVCKPQDMRNVDAEHLVLGCVCSLEHFGLLLEKR